MKQRKRHNLLFRVACEGLKLLAILLVAFICACLFLSLFGATQVIEVMPMALQFFLQLAACLLSLIAIAALMESLE
jgi:hypothetical protein